MPPIGLQLYTVRQEAERDLIGTLAAVAQIGYTGVEFASVPRESASQTAAALRDFGLTAAGIVVPMHALQDPAIFANARAYCHGVGSRVIVFPWLDEKYRADSASYEHAADLLNSFGAACHRDELRFLYHIHGYEFVRHAGSSGLEILMQRCDPSLVQLELDTFWVEHADQSALSIFEEYADRCPYIHFKDMNDRQEKRDVEVGDGIVDIAGIIRAAQEHAVEWFIVEQEQFDRPPMESIAISYRNLERLTHENTLAADRC